VAFKKQAKKTKDFNGSFTKSTKNTIFSGKIKETLNLPKSPIFYNFGVSFYSENCQIKPFNCKSQEKQQISSEYLEKDSRIRMKSLLEPNSFKDYTIKEPDRQRFSKFLRKSLEINKEPSNKRNEDFPQNKSFQEKLKNIQKQPEILQNENRDIRRVFRDFLTNTQTFLKPKRLSEAFDRDLENSQQSKSRLFLVKTEQRKYLMNLHYNPKKQKYQYKLPMTNFSIKSNRIKIAINNWKCFLEKSEKKPVEVKNPEFSYISSSLVL
jgi:hypothetical protein